MFGSIDAVIGVQRSESIVVPIARISVAVPGIFSTGCQELHRRCQACITVVGRNYCKQALVNNTVTKHSMLPFLRLCLNVSYISIQIMFSLVFSTNVKVCPMNFEHPVFMSH
ncbi:hypothetical protein AVEN_98947-1 [Araneus ventricosus]|uniref:Uncharacterized protein n=1 Tax=Araneus ventricosus TaxID=182803 RepID=A0A4Y2F638_ARAVE|nr:hypothetical protein AVEN_98947-1 [Araneus ventricosus]